MTASWMDQFKGRRIDYSKGRPAQLICHLDLKDFGGPSVLAGDLDGDGHAEFLITQEASGYNRRLGAGPWYRPEWETVGCTTAVRANGTILWQNGVPWNGPVEYPSHGGSTAVVCDIDADGKSEIVNRDGDRFGILDGATGTLRHSVPVVDKNINHIAPFFPRAGKPGRLVLKCGGATDVPGHAYAQGTYLYDAGLEQLAGPILSRFSGHHVGILPLENSRCGFLDGVCLYAEDGQKIWESDTREIIEGSHVDSLAVGDINGDGQMEIVYCFDGPGVPNTEYSMAAFTARGAFLWKVVSTHPQHVVIAAAREGAKLPQIYLGEKKGGIGAYDGNGQALWRRNEISAYPSVVCLGEGRDRILWRPHRMESIVPYVADEKGDVAVYFQECLAHKQRNKPLPFKHEGPGPFPLPLRRPHDFNFGYGCQVHPRDLDHDGSEVVIYDRYDLWIYKI